MLMSHGARSAGEIGWPKRGASAATAALTPSASTQARPSLSRVNMAHLALRVDAPAGNRVEVLHGEGADRRRALGLAALGEERGAARLLIAGLVDGAALQDGGAAVPIPRHAEAGEGLAQHRRLQRRLRPALAAVGRDLDLADAAVAGIREAGNLVEARRLHVHPGRGMGD